MSLCKHCGNGIKDGYLMQCKCCGATYCADCSAKTKDICPNCYTSLEING